MFPKYPFNETDMGQGYGRGEEDIAMRFAVISDIHGNLPALDTVVEDAKKNRADGFLFAGVSASVVGKRV